MGDLSKSYRLHSMVIAAAFEGSLDRSAQPVELALAW
jgi:hypothetical protein